MCYSIYYMKHFPNLLIVILIIVAVFLGFRILSLFSRNNSSILQQPPPKQMTELQQIMNAPRWLTLSPKERARLGSIVKKLGKDGNTIKISSECQVSPFVIRIKRGSNIIIQNTDNLQHEVFLFNKVATASAGQSVSLTSINLEKQRIYRYGCDKKASGYIFVST